MWEPIVLISLFIYNISNFVYRCYEYDVNTFDPIINLKHFHESIFKIVRIFLEDSDKSTDELCFEMVSLLIVTNLGDYNVLQPALPFITKKSVY